MERFVIPETPVVLSIAGSDCSAGAGLQADLKVFTALKTYGLTAVSAVVAETPLCVERIDPVAPDLLASQLKLLLATYPVAAAKTGMLPTAKGIARIAPLLQHWKSRNPSARLVVDPIIHSSTSRPLIEPAALERLTDELFPLADLITPNEPEALALAGDGTKLDSCSSRLTLARSLFDRFEVPVLLKGGHAEGSEQSSDLLVTGESVTEFSVARLPKGHRLHGTGCTLSAAITAYLGKRRLLEDAVAAAKSLTTQCLRNALRWDDIAALGFCEDGACGGQE